MSCRGARPNGVLAYDRQGDILVVWKLERLGRSLVHVIEVVQQLEAAKATGRAVPGHVPASERVHSFEAA